MSVFTTMNLQTAGRLMADFPPLGLPWLHAAWSLFGEREIPGKRHNAFILAMWRAIRRGGIKDDETAWCSALVGWAFEINGVPSSRFESARSWLDWGQRLNEPLPGCVVVLSRVDGGGHVGFVVGRTANGGLVVLSGNQDNKVGIAVFPRHRVLGYRWPAGHAVPFFAKLALGRADVSASEA
jgi:uncharacterized protein (TIGR02594 family)